jgi:hypothetical protein
LSRGIFGDAQRGTEFEMIDAGRQRDPLAYLSLAERLGNWTLGQVLTVGGEGLIQLPMAGVRGLDHSGSEIVARPADLDKLYTAVGQVMAKEKPTDWNLKAFKYYYIPEPPIGLAGIVVEPTPDLLRLQQELIDAVTPFTVKTGTAAAFVSTEDGRDIQASLIDYVANFVNIAAGEKFNPHVTIGVGTETYLKELLAKPYQPFTFSPVGASVYQLGAFGTARKELKVLTLKK